MSRQKTASNRSRPAVRRNDPNWVGPITSRWFLVVIVVKAVFRWIFKLTSENTKALPSSGPAILLANHVTLLDPIWVGSLLRRHIYYAANEDIFRNPITGALARWTGAFPIRKAATDMSAVRKMIRHLRDGRVVALYPEGVRTWDGTNTPLRPGIARLIQKMKVPIVGCRQERGYLALPRWARVYRGIPVHGVYKRIYQGNDIPDDLDKIIDDISGFIENRDYDLNVSDSRYKRRGLAVDVTKLIYRCPLCGGMESLRIVKPLSTNQVECSSCFSKWEITASGKMVLLDETGSSSGESHTLRHYYRIIKSLPLTPIRSDERLKLEDGEVLYLRSRRQLLKRERELSRPLSVGLGTAYLTDHRFIFQTTEEKLLEIPLKRMLALSTDPGDRFHFVFDKKIFYITIRSESILKWHDTIIRLRDNENCVSVPS